MANFTPMMSTSAPATKGLVDGRVDEQVENYTKFWQSDLKRESEAEVEHRIDDYTNIVNGKSTYLSLWCLPCSSLRQIRSEYKRVQR